MTSCGGPKCWLPAFTVVSVGFVFILAPEDDEGYQFAFGFMLLGFFLIKIGRLGVVKFGGSIGGDDAAKQQSMLDGFPESVKMVANAIIMEPSSTHDSSLKEQNEASSRLLLEPYSGVYSCLRSELTITDKKTSETVRSSPAASEHHGQEMLSEECTLSLKFSIAGEHSSATGSSEGSSETNSDTSPPSGWSIRGTNRVSKGGVYVIEEGFVSALTGKGYWVERSSRDSRLAILSTGQFKGDLFENSEFYTSFGQRGRYEEFQVVQQHDSLQQGEEPIFLAVPVGSGDSKALETAKGNVSLGPASEP